MKNFPIPVPCSNCAMSTYHATVDGRLQCPECGHYIDTSITAHRRVLGQPGNHSALRATREREQERMEADHVARGYSAGSKPIGPRTLTPPANEDERREMAFTILHQEAERHPWARDVLHEIDRLSQVIDEKIDTIGSLVRASTKLEADVASLREERDRQQRELQHKGAQLMEADAASRHNYQRGVADGYEKAISKMRGFLDG